MNGHTVSESTGRSPFSAQTMTSNSFCGKGTSTTWQSGLAPLGKLSRVGSSLSLPLIPSLSPPQLIAHSKLPNSAELKAAIGVNQNFGVPFDALVEFVISHLSILNANLMGDDETWLRLSRNNHISQVPVVGLDVALTRAQGQTLLEQFACEDVSTLPSHGSRSPHRRTPAPALHHSAYLVHRDPSAHTSPECPIHHMVS